MSAASRMPAQALGGGLAVTGNYPGKARTPDELRADFERPFPCIPGRHRFNLHACYAEMSGRKVERDELSADAVQELDRLGQVHQDRPGLQPDLLRPSQGGGRVHADQPGSRPSGKFWIEHGIRCREIGAAIGKALGKTCLTNLWIPDGMKDTPADRRGPRERLAESLDAVFKKKIDRKLNVDSVEPKLFGIGAESYTPGSSRVLPRLRREPANPAHAGRRAITTPPRASRTRSPPCSCYLPEIALHVSRGVRWDSDHVVTLTDDLQAIAQEIVWGGYAGRVRIGLDYFDASINRVAAWVIGARNMLKALLLALVAPDRQAPATRSRGRLHLAPGADGGGEGVARRRGLGLLLRQPGRAGRARPGWRRSSTTSARCSRSDPERGP